MQWPWSKRTKAEWATRQTNEMLARVAPALARKVSQWRLIECGRYQHKPTLSRALRHLAGFDNDSLAERAVDGRRVTLNDRVVVDAHERLDCGSYTVHIKGQGEYRFYIR